MEERAVVMGEPGEFVRRLKEASSSPREPFSPPRPVAQGKSISPGQTIEYKHGEVGFTVSALSDNEAIQEAVKEALSKDTLMKETVEVLAADNKLLRARLADFEVRLKKLERQRMVK